MPITTFVSILAAVLAGGAVTVMAIDRWGLLTILPVLMLIGLVARWAFAPVSPDDHAS